MSDLSLGFPWLVMSDLSPGSLWLVTFINDFNYLFSPLYHSVTFAVRLLSINITQNVSHSKVYSIHVEPLLSHLSTTRFHSIYCFTSIYPSCFTSFFLIYLTVNTEYIVCFRVFPKENLLVNTALYISRL